MCDKMAAPPPNYHPGQPQGVGVSSLHVGGHQPLPHHPPPPPQTAYPGHHGPPMPVMHQPQQHQNVSNSTNVVVNAPAAAGTVNVHMTEKREWSTQMLACADDVPACLAVCFCPSCYLLYLSYVLGEGWCMPLCVPGALIALRVKMRAENKIKGSIMNDCCVTCCCGMCAMCQMRREHDNIAKADLVKRQMQSGQLGHFPIK